MSPIQKRAYLAHTSARAADLLAQMAEALSDGRLRLAIMAAGYADGWAESLDGYALLVGGLSRPLTSTEDSLYCGAAQVAEASAARKLSNYS